MVIMFLWPSSVKGDDRSLPAAVVVLPHNISPPAGALEGRGIISCVGYRDDDVASYSAPRPAAALRLDLGDQKSGIVISGKIERFLILAARPM